MWSANHLKKAKPFMIHDGGLLMLVSNSVDVIFILVKGARNMHVMVYGLHYIHCSFNKVILQKWHMHHAGGRHIFIKGTICMPILD